MNTFGAEYVTPLRAAGKLRLDFDLDLLTVALILEYLYRIDALERQVRSLQTRLPAHALTAQRYEPLPKSPRCSSPGISAVGCGWSTW